MAARKKKAGPRAGKPVRTGGRPVRKAAAKGARKDRSAQGGEDLSRLRISVTTIGDLLLTAADRHPDSLALVFPERQFTYAELAARALERARSLRALKELHIEFDPVAR